MKPQITIVSKVAFLFLYCGLTLSVAAIGALILDTGIWRFVLLLTAVFFLALAVTLLQRDPYARSVGWKGIIGSEYLPPANRRGIAFVVAGIVGLIMYLLGIGLGGMSGRNANSVTILPLSLALIAIGVALIVRKVPK